VLGDGRDAEVELRVGSLAMRATLRDVFPLLPSDGGDGGGTAGTPPSKPKKQKAMLMPVVSRAQAAAAAAATQFNSRSVGDAAARAAAASPRAENTVDVRGCSCEEAVSILAAELRSRRDGGESVLFVVHGVGTGAVKRAVLEYARDAGEVLKVQGAAQRDGGAGCSLLLLR
jgi:DNA-nicking Smr family endonuclease